MIMQRYDPTKESDKRFEVPQADKNNDSGDAKPPPREETGEDKVNENRPSMEDASVSSGSSDEGGSTQRTIKSEGPESNTEEKPAAEESGKKSKTTTNVEGKIVPAKDTYEQEKLGDIFKQAREGKPESFSLGNLFQTEDKVKDSNRLVYEQDKLEGIFKQAQGDGASNAGAGGFSFGFQSQLPDGKTVGDEGGSAPFSFGFGLSNTSKDEKHLSPPRQSSEQNSTDRELKSDDAVQSPSTLKAIEDQPKNEPPQRKRRVGMRFPESDLDAWEEMFFSMNEGPQILRDLDAMKQDEESQERWQKERVVLTADWKRKQKSASSRKVKKARRM